MLKTFQTSYIGKKKSRKEYRLQTGIYITAKHTKMQNPTKPEIFRVMQMKYKR